MFLLLDRGAEFEQIFGDMLARGAEHVDQGAGLRFVVDGEEGYCEAGGTGATGSGGGLVVWCGVAGEQ